MYEASLQSKDLLKELIDNNPLQAEIKGSSQEAPLVTEEEKEKVKEAERKIEVQQQKMEEIVLAEGGEVVDKPKVHIHSATGKKVREDAKKAQEIRKKHAEKMKMIKSQNRKNMNPAFFSNAKGSVDENKGVGF